MKKLLILAAALTALVAAPWWGARQAITAMEQQRQTSDLALNMAYWATVLPGMHWLADVPQTQLALNWHQVRAGSEFADAAELQQRAERFSTRMQSWIDLPALRADGSINAQAFKAQSQALSLLARLPWTAAQPAALLPRLHTQVTTAMQTPAATALAPRQGFETAQTLAMLAARQHDATSAVHWMDMALQIMPQPADIKAHTAENTARHLLPVRVMLASCTPGQLPMAVPQAQAALQQGYDVQQLRQQYAAGWDRALLLSAQQEGTAAECTAVARQYKTLLTAAQP